MIKKRVRLGGILGEGATGGRWPRRPSNPPFSRFSEPRATTQTTQCNDTSSNALTASARRRAEARWRIHVHWFAKVFKFFAHPRDRKYLLFIVFHAEFDFQIKTNQKIGNLMKNIRHRASARRRAVAVPLRSVFCSSISSTFCVLFWISLKIVN